MEAKRENLMSYEEFFEWQEHQDQNYELRYGIPRLAPKAMTGASDRHDQVTVNILASLHARLKGKPCGPRTADKSLRTYVGTRRPDITIECGKPDEKSLESDDPRVVFEVASPSTFEFDRMEKLAEYQRHEKIKVIVLVDVYRPRAVVWRRSHQDWEPEIIIGLDRVIALSEIDTELPLEEIYEGLEFAED